MHSPSIMNFVDSCSLTRSSVSSINSICLPKRRIKCSKDGIDVGDSSFQSASDALLVYLQQYDVAMEKEVKARQQGSPSALLVSGSTQGESQQLDQYLAVADQVSSNNFEDAKSLGGGNVTRVAEDVEDLLTSRLCAEVKDAAREVRLQHSLNQTAPESSNHTKPELQHEVEAALLRSAKILEKVTKEDIPATRTHTIERKTPANDSLAALGSHEAGKRPLGHIYSYHSSHHRKTQNSTSMKSLHPLSTLQQAGDLRRCSSTDNLRPASHKLPPRHKHSLSSSSTSISYHSDPTGVRNLRTRSLSPGLRNATGILSTSRMLEHRDQTVKKTVPSWVRELSPSEVTDSFWESGFVQKETKPSRAGKVSVKDTEGAKRSHSFKDHDLNSNSGLTAGFNLSDIGLSAIHSSSNNKHSAFFNGTGKDDLSMDKPRIRHSSPIRDSLTSVYSSPGRPALGGRTFDSEYNGEAILHRCILPQTARLKKSIETFVASAENLKHKTLTSDSSVASSDAQCSSLDTLSLLTGKPLSRQEAAAASSLPQDITAVSQTYSTSSLVPASICEDRNASPVSVIQDLASDGLDGDRPWEKLAVTFKAPVPVGTDDAAHTNEESIQKNLQRTLSGRKQPGSMETLKNMLFKLQAEENATHRGNNKDDGDLNVSQTSNSKPYLDIIPALQDYDFQTEPGGQSLEKALVHLNRLKELVRSANTSAFSDGTVKTSTTVALPTSSVTHNSC